MYVLSCSTPPVLPVQQQRTSRSPGESRPKELARDRSLRNSKSKGDKKDQAENPGALPAFHVLGRHLSVSTVADKKSPFSEPTPSAAVNLVGTPTAPTGAYTPMAAVGASQRRASRATAVAAAVAAVASAKAATDNAVASVSSSGRHRSIGTSISDTLVFTAARRGKGGGGEGLDGGRGGVGGGGELENRGEGNFSAAWPEPAPGKEDRGGNTGVGAVRRFHRDQQRKGSSEEYKGANQIATVLDGGPSADDKVGEGRGSGKVEAWRSAGGKKQVVGEAVPAVAASAVSPNLIANPWIQDLRGGVRSLATLGGVGGKGGGEDSPPLLGSADSPPLLPRQSSPSSPSRRPPNTSQRIDGAITPFKYSATGFPVAPITVGNTDLSPGADATEGSRGNAFGVGNDSGENGGVVREDELGRTRPRTATRRWDRPGPPGEDEVIAKVLLSRAAVTSTLSNR